VLDERTRNIQNDVTAIKRDMATRSDQAHVDQRIADLTGLIAAETAERKASVAAEKRDRESSVRQETADRVAADDREASQRQAVAARLQVVEDRMENRKYSVAIAILIAAVGAVFGIASTLIQSGVLGGGS
jgi:hypothetical protein